MKESNQSLAPYLFHEGTNYSAYKYLGCHVFTDENGKYTYVFRTWAPNSHYLAVVGDFCDWEEGIPMQRITDGGVWECSFTSKKCFIGYKYKYKIATSYGYNLKGDPYAFSSQGGTEGASYICGDANFEWSDENWLDFRQSALRDGWLERLSRPINIYEVHLGSFMRHDDNSYLSYRELADVLVPYVKYMGYTHVELMPISEFPYDGSWGYQVCAYYAPSSRFGTPDDFRYFVSSMHKHGIGVILDWVGAHFPKDEWGLFEYDGRPLYEYQGYDRMESRSWGTRFFDLGRQEIQCFLVSNAMYWIEEFHIDGLRVDAVASMLYLDYDRSHGEWLPNVYGENKNLEAIAFIKKLNTAVHERHPDVLVIAEESTAWDGVTRSCADGGLGFDLKWNMGWANDFYNYVSKDPLYRRYHHSALNFPIMYAFNENFLLPVSHDEVVHGKGSFINKMHGSIEDKFAQVRASLLFMMTFPGKKMVFMGTEFAQFSEWDYDRSLEWFMLDFDSHFAMREYLAALNRFYLSRNELWELDFAESGFEWIYPDESDFNFVAYKRFDKNGNELICAVSFSGDDIKDIKIPVLRESSYETVFSTDALSGIKADLVLQQDGSCSLSFDLPRFGGVIFKKFS